MLMKFSMIQRKEKSTTSMVKMLLKKEWEEVAPHTVPLTFLSHFLEAAALVVSCFVMFLYPFDFFYLSSSLFLIFSTQTFHCNTILFL